MNDIEMIREYVKTKILTLDSRGYVKSRESTKLDFKESFNWQNNAEYIRTMAAFANNQGGFLVFGIKDSPREVIGLQGQAFENLTSEKISEFVKSTLSHSLSYEFETLELDNKKIGWIYTRQSQIKPVICTKTIGNDLKDGVIYFRNGARSEPIRSTELQKIIDDQRDAEAKRWMNLVKQAGTVGIDNAAILSLTDGIVSAPGGRVIIDESIMKDLRYIKEGEFNEKVGAPTLKIIGEVEASSARVIERNIDPEIKYQLTTKQLGEELGFPSKSAAANALALVKYFNLQSDEYMYSLKAGQVTYKKYSREVLNILREKANNDEFEIDKDSNSMKSIRKKARNL